VRLICVAMLLGWSGVTAAQTRLNGVRRAPIQPRDVPSKYNEGGGTGAGSQSSSGSGTGNSSSSKLSAAPSHALAPATRTATVAVTYAGSRAYPHYVVYPTGSGYPAFHPTSPWAGDEYDDPAMAGLATDEGFLELDVTAGAVVLVDGRPANGRVSVRPGRHLVEVSKPGFRTELYSVGVGGGRVAPIRTQLKPATQAREPVLPRDEAVVKVVAGAPGQRIIVDGEPWGETRAGAAGFLVLPEGDHTVRVGNTVQKVRLKVGAPQTLQVP
jgi:hypothetical protein